MLHETIRDRLRAEIARLGISAVELARRSEVKTSFIYDILNGKSTNPSGVKLAQVAKALGISLAYLAGSDESPGAAPADSVAVPLITAAGGNVPAAGAKRYYFRADWVRARWKTPDALRMVRVTGDGMTPTFHDGDVALVNTAERIPSTPGVFVLFDGMGLTLKRLESIASTPPRVRVLSDNARYSPHERALSELSIVGRVVWFSREL